jgi:hypothetical protein
MNPRNYGLKPDKRPTYEPAPRREYGRGFEMVMGCMTLAWIIAVCWALAYALHWIGGLL